jgi:hypothetical protein
MEKGTKEWNYSLTAEKVLSCSNGNALMDFDVTNGKDCEFYDGIQQTQRASHITFRQFIERRVQLFVSPKENEELRKKQTKKEEKKKVLHLPLPTMHSV